MIGHTSYTAFLREILSKRFSKEELRTLCADLDVDYESLTGQGKAGKARELIAYLERRGRLQDLVLYGKRNRPDISWEEQPAAPSSQPSSVALPITILFLGANPVDSVRLRLDQEVRDIDEALRLSEYRERFDLVQGWATRVTDLQGLLLRYKPHILHFSGHGSPKGELIMEDKSGRGRTVRPRALGSLFAALHDNLRCVMLNACYTAIQAQAIADQVDCVIGMSQGISDEAAVAFSVAFYQALGYGRDLQTAFDLGCVQIQLLDLPEDLTPRLLASRADPRTIKFAE
jgi:hypothetical protein